MHFGENQLSRGLISLSLLPSAHRRTFQRSPVRSSTWFYPCFNLAKGRSPPLRVQFPRLVALFGLAFASAPPRKGLALPRTLTRRLIKQKARHRSIAGALTLCRLTVSGSFSLRSQRFFSPFPRGTCSLSVADEYLALRGGPRGFAHRFTCDVLLRSSSRARRDFAHAAFTLSGRLFQVVELSLFTRCEGPSTPGEYPRFGLFRFRSPLLTESISLSFPPLTEMFHFSGFRVHNPMCSGYDDGAFLHQVTPFGYPRVFARLQLSEAFRSLLRPSSPVGTKAFSISPLVPLYRGPRCSLLKSFRVCFVISSAFAWFA